MAMVGQKTEEVYRRYAIVDEAMIREAAIKMNRGAKARRAIYRNARQLVSNPGRLMPLTLQGRHTRQRWRSAPVEKVGHRQFESNGC
jgi:hypothetical protein